MNNLQKFNFKNNDVRVEDRNGNIWFNLKDVCGVLDIKNSRNKMSLLKDNQKDTVQSLDAIGRKKDMTIISESGLYKIMMSVQKNPTTEKFQDWIAEEVLPSIRKTGKYQVPQSYEEVMLNALKLASSKVEEQKALLLEAKPKVDFFDDLANSKDDLSLLEGAKLLNTGRNKLTAKLRELKIFFKDNGSNIPYQQYLDTGYFVVKLKKYAKGDDIYMSKTTFITQKGLKYLQKKLRVL